jgi:hypothetical protein
MIYVTIGVNSIVVQTNEHSEMRQIVRNVDEIRIFVNNAISTQQIPTLPAWVKWGAILPYSLIAS